MSLSTLAMIAAGTAAGALATWFLAMVRHGGPAGMIEEDLRTRIAANEREITDMRAHSTSLVAANAEAVTAGRIAGDRLAETLDALRDREGRLEAVQARLGDESGALARAQADLQAARNLLSEKQALHEQQLKDAKAAQEKSIADLREAFRALSADALKQNAPEFLRLARETFGRLQESAKGDLEKRQEAIAGLLKPLEEQLKTYQQRLQQSETNQSQTLGEVRKQIETLGSQSQSLASETERFRMVLKSNQARGRWGEETLRRVVEASGMSAQCDFVEQTRGEEGQPDMIVKLPGGRVIIVDSKVPDLDFVSALETADIEKRTRLLESHASKLRDTIRALAKRDYPRQFDNALDHVVLFLPAESLFSAALEGDRNLILWAAENRIMLATPASLIALLRSVSVSWQQFAQTENTRAILEAARELFGRVARFTEHFERMRSGLGRANEAFNDAVGSYERMVRPSGERLLGLGLDASGRELAGLKPMDDTVQTDRG